MKFCWYVGGCAILLSVLLAGCGGGTAAPKNNEGGIGQGPPMPAGEKSPLMSGSAEEAERMGRGPGRSGIPEGARNTDIPQPGGGPGGGGAPQGPPQ